jgi:hypothetical protein
MARLMTGSAMPHRGNDSGNCCLAHAEYACHLGGGFAARYHTFRDFGTLLGIELWAPTADAPLRSRLIETCLCSFPDHGTFEFGETPNHLHHHSACWGGGVDILGEGAEPYMGELNLFEKVQQILESS